MDIDFDTQALRRKNILLSIKDFFGFDNVLNIATFGTVGPKSACTTAVRGYRTEEFPDGIDADVGTFLSTMIPTERGNVWPLHDVINGNKDKDRKPIRLFVNEVEKYDGLLDILLNIEGLIDKRSIHASGVYIYNNGYLKHNALMRAPNGQETTQFDMEDSDYMGGLKFDFLTIEALDCERICVDLLIEDGLIEKQATLKATYNKYLHPDVLDYDNKEIWDLASSGEVTSLFQFETPTGSQAAKKIKPKNLIELAQANSLMRLMAEKGEENPIDKFVRFKNNIQLWYQEMNKYKLSEEEIKVLEKHLLKYSGVAATQEDLMIILMDEDVASFSIPEANKARKAVAKKKATLMAEVKELFYERCKNKTNLANYIWDNVIMPQAGYSFSINHTTPYSIIALQEMTLFHNYPSIYWNTACLSVRAGAADEYLNEDFREEEEEELDEEEIESGSKKDVKKKKPSTTDYGKIAKAIGEMNSRNISIVPPNINMAKFDFRPDSKQNRIIYGLMGLNRVGKDVIEEVIVKRPFTSVNDYLEKVKANKLATLSLIKSGAFDEVENKPREEILKEYITDLSSPKEKLDLKNLAALIERDLIPESLEFYKRLASFNKYIKQKHFKVIEGCLIVDDRSSDFLLENFVEVFNSMKLHESGARVIDLKLWEKTYTKSMKVLSNWLKENQKEVLEKFNKISFDEEWEKYCSGNISKWEMDSMCYYYHEHELARVNLFKYNISNFKDLPEEPTIDKEFYKDGRTIPLYKLTRIIGTVIKKQKANGTFTLLTIDGVIDIRLNNEFFSLYDKRLSAPQPDGKSKVMENSWFTRGNKIMVLGYRRGDQFVPKKYKNSVGHRLALITDVKENGDIEFTTERWKAGE